MKAGIGISIIFAKMDVCHEFTPNGANEILLKSSAAVLTLHYVTCLILGICMDGRKGRIETRRHKMKHFLDFSLPTEGRVNIWHASIQRNQMCCLYLVFVILYVWVYLWGAICGCDWRQTTPVTLYAHIHTCMNEITVQ